MIIDASVAVPWLIETPFSPSAQRLRPIIAEAPSLLMVETTNVLLKYLRAGVIRLEAIPLALQALHAVLSNIVSDSVLLPSATQIAAADSQKIYDCLYIALALELRKPLATADKRLAALARGLDVEVKLILPSA